MRKYLSSAILLLIPFTCAFAQNDAIELQTDKKVIHVDKLGMADNTPVLEILQMIPELVVREGNDFLSGYDVSLDDKSLGSGKDVLLGSMKLYEIEKIEITTSATAAQQVNGMSGLIKIVSKSMEKGVSGNVSANVSSLWNAYPNLTLNYRTDKLELRGNVGMEYFSGGATNYYDSEYPRKSEIGEDIFKEKYFQETARIYLKYRPTSQDQLKIWVSESFERDDRNNFTSSLVTVPVYDYGKDIYRITEERDTNLFISSNLKFSAFAEYNHVFRDKMEFVVSADYIQDGKRDGEKSLEGIVPDKPKTMRSHAKFVLPFIPSEGKEFEFTLGGNAEYNIRDNKNDENRSLYLSPYLGFKYTSPKLKLNAGARYQYDNFIYNKSSQGLFSKGSNDFTFNVNSLWQIADHHGLRFLVAKNIIRPTFNQMYPVMEWDFKRRSYSSGNSSLHSASMYSFDLDYFADWKIGPHGFIADVSFGYDRADGLVSMIKKYDGEYGVFYTTYNNSGVNDIFKSKVNVIYSYGGFSISLAGNWYHNIKTEENKSDNVENFNIALSPVICFRDKWTLSGTLKYNNPLISNDSRIGECLYSYLRLSKSWGKWTASAVLSDIFDYLSENYEYRDEGYIYTMYDQYPRCFELGIAYRIGR